MRRSELEQLSPESLLDLAEEHDIDSAEELSRDTLVELLLEAFEEEREELEAQNNNPVTVEEKKYTRFGDRPIAQGDADIELVDSYNDTRLVLLIRDPSWAYAYWDLRESIEQEIAESEGEQELLLRIYEVPSVRASVREAFGSFDIPVRPSDREWYVNIPTSERAYVGHLVRRSGDRYQVQAVSNPIWIPRGGIAEPNSSDDEAEVEKLIALSGLDKLDIAGSDQAIPQRIASLLEERV
jgi:hypothetical protein